MQLALFKHDLMQARDSENPRHERGPQRATMKFWCIGAEITVKALFKGEGGRITCTLRAINLFHIPAGNS